MYKINNIYSVSFLFVFTLEKHMLLYLLLLLVYRKPNLNQNKIESKLKSSIFLVTVNLNFIIFTIDKYLSIRYITCSHVTISNMSYILN